MRRVWGLCIGTEVSAKEWESRLPSPLLPLKGNIWQRAAGSKSSEQINHEVPSKLDGFLRSLELRQPGFPSRVWAADFFSVGRILMGAVPQASHGTFWGQHKWLAHNCVLLWPFLPVVSSPGAVLAPFFSIFPVTLTQRLQFCSCHISEKFLTFSGSLWT